MAAGQRMVYPAETVFSAPYVTHITGILKCELRVAGEQGEVTPSSVLVQLRK
jgi:hypothetical protein